MRYENSLRQYKKVKVICLTHKCLLTFLSEIEEDDRCELMIFDLFNELVLIYYDR